MQDLAGLWKQYMVEAQLTARKSWDGGRVLQERHSVSVHAKRRHKRAKGLQKMLGRRKFQSVKEERVHMQVRQVFSPGTPNGMKTL